MIMSGGFSAARLKRMNATMAGHAARGDVAGLVTLLSRRGEVLVEAHGTLAAGGSEPMRRDTIFRIASMTKPITAAAAMILVEECRIRLDHPVDKWLPELANRKVLKRLDGPLDGTVPAQRPITLRDLLTFRAGFGAIMIPGRPPIQKAMDEAGVSPGPRRVAVTADEYMKRLGALPLAHQPGELWLYHTASEALGVLIARASGQSLGTFMRERIFEPLGMTDTGFDIPAAKVARMPDVHRFDAKARRLVVNDDAAASGYARPAIFEAGGGGLLSTADDYLKFCRMLLDKGRCAGGRILSRPSVELMTADQLTTKQKEDARMFFGDSAGWGFGMAVVTKRTDLFGPGRFGWDGGYGTSAHSDPAEDLVGILLTQRMMDSPSPPKAFTDFWTSAYQAIDD
jgi:CubicO group peptidase (beta-lactamase class C family)